jgi:hypothetical protein
MNMGELLARHPREHTDDDLRAMITELRAARSKFVVGGDKTAGALTQAQKEITKIDLDVKL